MDDHLGLQILRAPITRLDIEKHMVFGYASTGKVDAYDTVFDPSWWPHAVSGYLQDRSLTAMHGEERIGTVPILEIDNSGLWIGAEITDAEEWLKVESGEYNGFSIEAIPYASRIETRDGKEVAVFTKYVLDGITIGYPVANLDARFRLVERLAYDDSSPWDWDWTKDADAIVEQLGWDGLRKACLYQNPDADPKTKEAYKLPVAKLKSGKLTVFRNGVRAAMAVLNGGRGGVDIPEDARKAVYAKLKKLYAKFGETAPELRLDNGGTIMSTFTDNVATLLKRLSGKEPDDAAKKEIGDLEKSLSDDRTKQIETLTKTVEGLTARLEKLEKPSDAGGAGKNSAADDGTTSVEEFSKLDTSLKKLEERLGKVETRLTKSQQPGEGGGGDGGKPTDGKGMNTYIRRSLGR